jgi:LmbE family N-acetylglucosaminyl deacetylase
MKKFKLESLTKKDLSSYKIALVFPHPDDEVPFSSGLTYRYSNKCKIKLFCLTKGEATTVSAGPDIVDKRRGELAKSCRILGIDYEYLDFIDGEIKREYNRLVQKLTKLLVPFDMVITYEPNGISGHVDHVYTSKAVKESFNKTIIGTTLEKYIPSEGTLKLKGRLDRKPTPPSHYINLSTDESLVKLKAFLAHGSQFGPQNKDFYKRWRGERRVLDKEYFIFL